MLEGQQRDVGKRLVLNDLTLLPEVGNDLMNVKRIPVQNGI